MNTPKPGCRFCLENDLLYDEPIYRNEAFYVLGMLDRDRYEAVMIVPYEHSDTPFEMSSDTFSHLPDALAFAKERLAQYNADGYTIGWNVGAPAGQTVFHAHLHVMCRFKDDPVEGRGIAGLLRLARVGATATTD